MSPAPIIRVVLAALLPLCLVGCMSIPRQQTTSAPVSQGVQQAGAANLAAQAAVEAPGWKAIEYHSDLPWKAVLVLVSYVLLEALKQSWIVYLSHSREMRRIANGSR
ncbi:MAG: hypothetical protein AB1508_18975 [Pseudomonadota bacterium]